ncbi:MAG: FeoA family protein [bacterium]
MKKLSDLMPKSCFVIEEIDSLLQDSLLAYGLFPGTDATLLYRLPFKGPLVLLIRDSCISLRYAHAKKIGVREYV